MVEWNRFLSISYFFLYLLSVSRRRLLADLDVIRLQSRVTFLSILSFLFFHCLSSFLFLFQHFLSHFLCPFLLFLVFVVKNIGECRNFYRYLLSKCFLRCVIMLHPFVLDSSFDKLFEYSIFIWEERNLSTSWMQRINEESFHFATSFYLYEREMF